MFSIKNVEDGKRGRPASALGTACTVKRKCQSLAREVQQLATEADAGPGARRPIAGLSGATLSSAR